MKLTIIGASGHGRVVADIAILCGNAARKTTMGGDSRDWRNKHEDSFYRCRQTD